MKSLRKGVAALAVLTAVAVGGTIGSGTAWAHRGGGCACAGEGGGWSGHGHRLAKALGLSGEQREQVKAIFARHRGEMTPLRKEMAAERREMGKLVGADKPDEAAIREQAKKIAATAGDLAVRRAKMFQEVRAVLTPEQVRKLRDLQERRERRIDRMMKRGEERRSNGE